METYYRLIAERSFLDAIASSTDKAAVTGVEKIERFGETDGVNADLRELYQMVIWLHDNPDIVKVSIQFLTAALVAFAATRKRKVEILVRMQDGDDRTITIDENTTLKLLEKTVVETLGIKKDG